MVQDAGGNWEVVTGEQILATKEWFDYLLSGKDQDNERAANEGVPSSQAPEPDLSKRLTAKG